MMIIDSSSNFEGNSLSINNKPGGVERILARIYLNTLASFSDHRAGSYAISAVKKTVGTGTFLELPSENRKCQLQTIEDCQVQQYVKEVKKECGCVPWALSKVLNLKVGFAPIDPFTIFFKALKLCSPNSSACYTAVSTAPHNCKVSCTGLYADVLFADNAPVEMTEKDLMMRKIAALTKAGIKVHKKKVYICFFNLSVINNPYTKEDLKYLLDESREDQGYDWFFNLQDKYKKHKNNFARNIKFDSTNESLGKYALYKLVHKGNFL